jgi:hypothetical protein
MLAQYARMHDEGERFLGVPASKTFPGKSLFAQVGRIGALVKDSGATNLLDYGCGKGLQYAARDIDVPGVGPVESVQDYWEVDFIWRFDPAFRPLSAEPEGVFGGVICTDVLEHVPEEDLGWVLDDLFGYASRFVFASVACYPASKRLPDGGNAHCTLLPPASWRDAFRAAARAKPGIRWQLVAEERLAEGGASRRVEHVFDSTD